MAHLVTFEGLKGWIRRGSASAYIIWMLYIQILLSEFFYFFRRRCIRGCDLSLKGGRKGNRKPSLHVINLESVIIATFTENWSNWGFKLVAISAFMQVFH